MNEEFNGFCYVYEGSGTIGGSKAGEQQALVMGKGAYSLLPMCGKQQSAVLCAARRCTEHGCRPIASKGGNALDTTQRPCWCLSGCESPDAAVFTILSLFSPPLLGTPVP